MSGLKRIAITTTSRYIMIDANPLIIKEVDIILFLSSLERVSSLISTCSIPRLEITRKTYTNAIEKLSSPKATGPKYLATKTLTNIP